nr:hypothetical protein JVH1_8368 [Rhodococcus sp. JVH1]
MVFERFSDQARQVVVLAADAARTASLRLETSDPLTASSRNAAASAGEQIQAASSDREKEP